jgi:hypothetical protein
MSESIMPILLIALLIGVFILSKRYQAWRVGRACSYVVKDLASKGAQDTTSAVELPYAKISLYHIGLRDFRPKAVEYLVLGKVIEITDEGKYYLKKNDLNPPE